MGAKFANKKDLPGLWNSYRIYVLPLILAINSARSFIIAIVMNNSVADRSIILFEIDYSLFFLSIFLDFEVRSLVFLGGYYKNHKSYY